MLHKTQRPPMPAPTDGTPWDSGPGRFFIRASTGIHQATRFIEATSLDDAIAQSRTIFANWPDQTIMDVSRLSAGERWRGTLA